jgi:hypothetical protein
MIEFRQRSLWERIARVWPPHRRRQDAALRAAIAHLVDNPTLPCVIGGQLIVPTEAPWTPR